MAACLHLSNTVLIDRALIIAKSRYGEASGGGRLSLHAPRLSNCQGWSVLNQHETFIKIV